MEGGLDAHREDAPGVERIDDPRLSRSIDVLLRRRSDLQRDYSIWGYPVLPAIFTVAAFTVVINQVVAHPGETLSGLALVLAGLPVYYLWARRGLVPKAAP